MEAEAVTVADEESADFARVGAMVGAGEPGPGAVTVPEQGQPRVDAVDSLSGLLSLVGVGFGVAGMKRAKALWPAETCADVAQKTVPVLRKYPWGARVLAFLEEGTGAEEMALVLCVAPLGLATWKAAQLDMAGDAEKSPPSQPQQRIEPVKTETVSAPADLGGLVEVHGRAD